jgi:hypothetical protein
MKFVESIIAHYSQARLFIWKKVDRRQNLSADAAQKFVKTPGASISAPGMEKKSRLKDLAWSLELKQGQELRTKKQENAKL